MDNIGQWILTIIGILVVIWFVMWLFQSYMRSNRAVIANVYPTNVYDYNNGYYNRDNNGWWDGDGGNWWNRDGRRNSWGNKGNWNKDGNHSGNNKGHDGGNNKGHQGGNKGHGKGRR